MQDEKKEVLSKGVVVVCCEGYLCSACERSQPNGQVVRVGEAPFARGHKSVQ